ARVALGAQAEPAVVEAAALTAGVWLARVEERTREALALVSAACAACPPGYVFGPHFLRLGVECAAQPGEAEVLEALLAAPVRPAKPGDADAARSQADLDLRRAERLIQTGAMDRAERLIRHTPDL